MSSFDRKGSTNTHKPRRNPFNVSGNDPAYETLPSQGPMFSVGDSDTTIMPKSIERRMSRHQSDTSHSGRRLVGYSISDSIYVKPKMASVSLRTWLVLPYSFLYMSAFTMSFSTLVQYTYHRVKSDLYPNVDTFNSSMYCGANKSEPDYQKQINVQTDTSNWMMYFSLAAGVPGMFASIIFGSSSDKFGRKFLFYLPCLGAIIRLTVLSFGIYFNFNLLYFLIGFAVDGITGYIGSMLLVTFSYVADITPARGKQRSFVIILVELINGIAATVFSFVTGYFIHYTGYFYPMLTSGILVFICLFIAFFIPETFPKEKRNNESILDKLKSITNLYFTSVNKGRRWMYNIVSLIFILTLFSSFGIQNIEPIYQMDEPFCWHSEKIGYFGALSSFIQQVLGLGLFKVLQKGMSDEAVAMLGSLSICAASVLEGMADSDIMLYIVPAVGLCGLLTVPICRSLLSKLTKTDHQGAIFAAIATIETAINIGSSIGSNEIYIRTISFYRGFVFFMFAGFNFVSLILMGIYRFGSRRTYPIPLDVRP